MKLPIMKQFTFLVAARRDFDPIARRFGMRCASSSEWHVRYESDVAFLNISFDGIRSFEVGVDIGQREPVTRESSFSLGELVRLRDPTANTNVDGLQVKDQMGLEHALKLLADLASRYGQEAFLGDVELFKELAELRDRECQIYARNRDLRIAREDAQDAWAHRDYAKLIQIYGAIEVHLSPAERKKYEYSKKHAAGIDH